MFAKEVHKLGEETLQCITARLEANQAVRWAWNGNHAALSKVLKSWGLYSRLLLQQLWNTEWTGSLRALWRQNERWACSLLVQSAFIIECFYFSSMMPRPRVGDDDCACVWPPAKSSRSLSPDQPACQVAIKRASCSGKGASLREWRESSWLSPSRDFTTVSLQ